MTGQSVRREFMVEFRGLTKNKRAHAVAIVMVYVLQLLLGIIAGSWLLAHGSGMMAALGVPVLMVFITTRLRGFNNIVHECCHYTFSSTREDNRILGSLSAALVFNSFKSYQKEHLTHHAHLGDYDHDLDFQGIESLHLEDAITPKTIAKHVITPLIGRHFPYYLNLNWSDEDGRAYQVLKFAMTGAAVVFTAFNPVVAILMVWVPYLWMYSAFNYWTDCIDHGGVVHSDDELDSSRNFIVPQPFRMLFFPRYDCFHLVHHLFPQIPAQHLEDCHARLMENYHYRTRHAETAAPEIMIPAE